MKSTKDFRGPGNRRSDSDDLHRGTKLPPAKKSGKERYSIYGEDDGEELLLSVPKKESAFDYFDDGEDER